jgi:hypothetical protein
MDIYKMYRKFIRENIPLVSIILFIIIFILIQLWKPSFLYNRDGSLREFGIGYKNKTIFPLWLCAIVLGILSYVIVMYYLMHPKIF